MQGGTTAFLCAGALAVGALAGYAARFLRLWLQPHCASGRGRCPEPFCELLERVPEGACLLCNGQFYCVNRAAMDLLGAASRAELIGARLEDWLVAAGHDFSRLAETPEQFESTCRRRDGTELQLAVFGGPARISGRHGAILFLRDVSLRRLEEQEKRLLEEQVRHAQKMETIGQLAGGVAHDFNNHLTVINGYTALLLKRSATSDWAQEALSEILSAGERAAALTRQLLTFSRKQASEPKVLDLNLAVLQAARMLQRLVSADVEVVTRLAARPAHVLMDEGQVNQILMNLAVNARDAMPNGGVLTLGTSREEYLGPAVTDDRLLASGTYVVLTVTDTGVGMPPEIQSRIFEPFFTTKHDKGTGLGLSMVYGIAKQAGGEVFLSSEVGTGTTFRILLPAMEAAANPPVAMGPAAGTETGCGERILLVEDDPVLRKFAALVLTTAGYQVLEAAGSMAALELLARETEAVALLLTDMVLPGMPGIVLAEKVCAADERIRVLYMSGYWDEGITGSPVPESMFLAKPFTAEDLLARVRQVLGAPAME